ncbi:hypothetical protein [Flavobacterium limi]|nr:hypothetical protein [Flavobacterium limi]
MAQKQLTLQYYDTKTKHIYNLINYANFPELRSGIISFIENSFDTLRKEAYNFKTEQDKIWNDGYESSVMVNSVAFGALVRTAGMLGEKRLAPLLYKEFLGLEEEFYELNLERGTLSIALSILSYEGDIKEIQDILDDAVSNQYDINEREHIMKMFYAFCILKKDKTRALDYLSNYKRTENLSFVAAALADLDVKNALPILRDRLNQLDCPITKEVFLEAIYRLEVQTEIPDTQNRMIWMFGKRNDTELALGNDTDNIFTLRAIEKTGDSELGIFYE